MKLKHVFLFLAFFLASLWGVSAEPYKGHISVEKLHTAYFVKSDQQGGFVPSSLFKEDDGSTGDWWHKYEDQITTSESSIVHMWKLSKNFASAYVAVKLGFDVPAHTILTYKVHCKAYVDAASYGYACAISEIYDYGAYDPFWPYTPLRLYSAEYNDIKPNRNIYDSNVKRRVGMKGSGNGQSNKQTSEDYTFTVKMDNGSGRETRTDYRVIGLHGNENKSGSTSYYTFADLRAYYEITDISYVREVVFDHNDGTGYMENQYGNYGFKLDKCTFTRWGYEFDGWATKRNGPKVYDDQQTMPVPSINDYGKITLYARWKPRTYTYTFKCQDGNGGYRTVGTESAICDAPFPVLAPATYSNPENRSIDDYYLAGYYYEPNGKYKSVYTHDLTPRYNKYGSFADDHTFYAHYVRRTYDVYWDYTYQTSQGYANISETDETNRINKAFMELKGFDDDEFKYYPIKSALIQGPAVQNKTGDITGDFASHTAAHTRVHLCVRPSEDQQDVTLGEDVYIYLTDEELSNVKMCTFAPRQSDGELPKSWITVDTKDQFTTAFAFTGGQGDNLYEQKWRVNLSDLQVYPEHIYVMPLFYNNQSKWWEPISQLANTIGVRCDKAQDGNYYTGSFPVWIKGADDEYSLYAIGLVGFSLGGKLYFLNKDNEGAWEPNFRPTAANYGWNPNGVLIYDLSGNKIPVVRFMVDAENGEQLNRNTPEILVTSYGETITDFARTYQATREGYVFTGWEDAEHNPVPAQGNDLVVTSAHTVYPKWHSNDFTVTLRNGEGMDNGSVTVAYGQKLPDVTPPVRTGYIFGGYYFKQGDVETQYYDAEGRSSIVWNMLYDITLNARWTPLQYTITLKNGEGFENVTATATYGQPWPWIQRPIREDALFEGYYTEEGGAGTKYFDNRGNLVSEISKQWNLTENLTLYANWGDAVAQIGGNSYPSLASAVEAAGDGDRIILLNDISLDNYVTFWKDVTLDLNNHSIVNKENTNIGQLLYLRAGVTICGCGSLRNSNGTAIYLMKSGSTVTMNIDGRVEGSRDAIQIWSGKVVINSGEYSMLNPDYYPRLLWFNVLQYYNDKTAEFIIKGGTFVGINPADHRIDSSIPNANLVADGYTSYKGNNAWTVLPNEYNVIFTTGNDVGGYKLSEGDNFNLQDAGFGKMAITEDVASVNVNYSRTITKDWQSWYAPFDVQLTNDHADLTFARITGLGTDGDGNTCLLYTEVTSGTLLANTPYIVRRNTEESKEYAFGAVSVCKTESKTTYFDADNYRYAFTGVYNTIALTGNPYWAFDLDGTIAWTDMENAIENPMRFVMRIYDNSTGSYKVVDPREGPNSSRIRFMRLIDDDEATSILTSTKSVTNDSSLYDLNGRMLTQPVKGISITNGKKYINK